MACCRFTFGSVNPMPYSSRDRLADTARRTINSTASTGLVLAARPEAHLFGNGRWGIGWLSRRVESHREPGSAQQSTSPQTAMCCSSTAA
eukprot:2471523-Pyramimonas_sp.AAC.1